MSKRMKKAFAKKMEELEGTKKARLQIERFKRQYKIMEGSRLAYNDEIVLQLDKKKGNLKQLKLDKTRLDSEGQFLTSPSYRLQEVKLRDRIVSLLKRKNNLDEEVKEARNSLLEISSQILGLESDLDHQRLTKIDRQAKLDAIKNRESKISYFESHLSMEKVELNKLMTKIRRTREEMEGLLRERSRFKELLDRLLSQLTAGRALIDRLMEQGTLAFQHREEAQNKLQLLRRKMMTLREKHGQAMRNLERELEDNLRSATFITTKAQERGGKAAKLEEEEAKRLQLQDEVRKLEAIYNKIITLLPGIQDSSAMADQYLIQEDENFAIFNYVNEVNCEVENIQSAAEETRRTIAGEEEKAREERKRRKTEQAGLEEKLAGRKEDLEGLVALSSNARGQRDALITAAVSNYKLLSATSKPSPYEIFLGEKECLNNPEFIVKLLEKKLRDTLKGLKLDPVTEPRFSMKEKKQAFLSSSS